MPRRPIISLFFILILFSTAAHASTGEKILLSQENLAALLLRTENNFGAITSLKTRFVQEKHLSFFTQPVETRGICLFQAPDRIRFETTEPYRAALIVADKAVGKFEAEEGNWKRIQPGNTDGILMVIGQIRSWLKGRFREAENLYHIEAETGEYAIITLTPKDPRFKKMLRSIEIGLKPGETGLQYIRLNEGEKDFTRITFFADRLNCELPADLFRTDLLPPAPVEPW